MDIIKNFINDYGLTLSTGLFILTLVFKLVSVVLEKLGFKKAAKVMNTGSALIAVIRLNMQKAETLFDDGAVKLEYVITKVQSWCIQNNVEFDENQVKQHIEDEISLSKCVNYDDSKDSVSPDL